MQLHNYEGRNGEEGFHEIAGAALFLTGFVMLPAGFVVGPTIAATKLPADLALIAYTVAAFTLIVFGGWYANQPNTEVDQ